MADQDQILLQTKLHRPHLPHGLVVRTRLVEWLGDGKGYPLTLVCAPAGFGKTSLIGSWLEDMQAGQAQESASLPSAWLSLDANDSDLNIFLRYFIAAIRTVYHGACEATLALLLAQHLPPQAVLFATFSNELNDLPGKMILVLDDYHAIRNRDIHKLVGELMQHWPKPLHLVVISRIDPPLPLAGFRAKGMIREIRTQNLRFTPQETATFLEQSQLPSVGRNTLPLLEERLEGWPAGLHLAALSLRAASSQEAVLSILSSENANITGYLMDEVLTQQLPVIHSFLLQTSILNRFSASLCEAVIGDIDPAWSVRACLDWIERSELFITVLDNRREWYRYHHLFQESLQQRLSAEIGSDQVADLHRLASNWFEKHGLLDEALQHSLAAGDWDLTARQMSAGLRDVLNREDRPTLERWLQLLPEEVIQQYPELLLIRAWVLQFLFWHDLQIQVVGQVEDLLNSNRRASLLESDLQILHGQLLLMKGQQAFYNNRTTQAIDLCKRVLGIFPTTWKFIRSGAMLYLGMSLQSIGQAVEAERLLLAEYDSCVDKTDPYAVRILLPLCLNYLNAGQLEQTRKIAEVMHQAADRSGLAIVKYWGDYFSGVVHYQWNELEVAAQHFTRIVENPYTAQVLAYRQAVADLAVIHQIQGRSTDAWQLVESISQFDLEQRGREDPRTQSLRARLMLLQGDPESAGTWVDTLSGPPPDQPLLWFEEPQVTRVRVLLARGSGADLQLGIQILNALSEIVERTCNTRLKMVILALRAMALEAQGEISEADSILKQAVDLSRPGGFIRVFADLGGPMQRMLGRLVGQGYSVMTVHRILRAFPEVNNNLVDGPSPAQPVHHPSLSNLTLAEPLTSRELEILVLLREPLSIKEIANKLNILPATARRHTVNIYAKLGVNKRWNAVARAEELKILPPR
ncbi:MAG: LuxR C-terminal-related transcriptional regulator [Bacteroidota bacterium]